MKKLLTYILIGILLISFGGCAKKESAINSNNKKVIKVGASAVPHSEILNEVKEDLAKEGYTLEVVIFSDYVLPNTALNEGQLDANFFQHVPYLEEFNKNKGTNLVWTTKVHIEPLGIYSKKIKSLNDLKSGATITIPNDPTNGSRALKLLEKSGLIKLDSEGLVNKQNIKENSKNLNIKEIDAPQLPRTLEDSEIAVINTNYAISAGLNPVKDALILEDKDSPYANVIAVKKGNENEPWVKALDKALTSEKVKKFISEKYNNSVMPAF